MPSKEDRWNQTPEELYIRFYCGEEGTKNKVRIVAPFVNVTKDFIVKVGTELDFPFEKTITCYNNEEPACGECNACKLRAEAFRVAGQKDPVVK